VTVARLRLFGAAVDAAGRRESDVDGETVDEVLAAACARYGDAFADVLGRSKVWVNGEPAAPGDRVAASDELAVLPPVSGGSGR
jgi:molybdopterin converting factor small subunit